MSTSNQFFNVVTTKDVRTQIAELRGQIARLEKQVAEESKWDALKGLPDRSVIRFDKRLGSTDYTYAAVKVKGLWYLTGGGSVGSAYDHEQIVRQLQGVAKVGVMTFVRSIGQ